MPTGEALYIGLMSGTSVDSIDAALVDLGGDTPRLLQTHEHPIGDDRRRAIAAISQPGDDEIARMGTLDRELGTLFARAALDLLDDAGIDAGQVTAIGSHGQTIRHLPPSCGAAQPFTLQIGDPNTIAEMTGITTVADFRRRDIAAGGEGAPLAPAFHSGCFSRTGTHRAIVNVGGIANISLLAGEKLVAGFDCGPGNTLMDHWIAGSLGQDYDSNGAWAAQGTVNEEALKALLADPYFELSGPRSTGKELFNPGWVARRLQGMKSPAGADMQATLLELSATAICNAITASPVAIEEVYVCGGGAHNGRLMQRLSTLLAPAPVATTEALGLHPDWVEAVAFAWLAQQTLAGLAGNAPVVTGANNYRVLGAVYAGNQK